MNRELMMQSLKALLTSKPCDKFPIEYAQHFAVIEALEKELEKPDPNPVAWGMPDACHNIVETISPYEKEGEMKLWANQYSVPLYTKEQP